MSDSESKNSMKEKSIVGQWNAIGENSKDSKIFSVVYTVVTRIKRWWGTMVKSWW